METNPDKTIEVLVNNAGIRDDGLMMWMKKMNSGTGDRYKPGGFFYVNPTGGEQHADEKMAASSTSFLYRPERHGRTNQLLRCQSGCDQATKALPRNNTKELR